jgi:hypothetical protein
MRIINTSSKVICDALIQISITLHYMHWYIFWSVFVRVDCVFPWFLLYFLAKGGSTIFMSCISTSCLPWWTLPRYSCHVLVPPVFLDEHYHEIAEILLKVALNPITLIRWCFPMIFPTGACGQDTASPLFTHYPLFSFFFLHFHGLEICNTAIICRFLIA